MVYNILYINYIHYKLNIFFYYMIYINVQLTYCNINNIYIYIYKNIYDNTMIKNAIII